LRSRLLACAAGFVAVAATPVIAAAPAAAAAGHEAGHEAVASGPLGIARDAAPVVMTGAQIPAWAAPPAEGVAAPQPSGASSDNPLGDQVRSAHNGILTVPPTPPGIDQVDPSKVAAYSWADGAWKQIPVQVDERFPYFLANGHSDFGFYSGTDEELTYAWGGDGHDVGSES
jgi:hypothetical protein